VTSYETCLCFGEKLKITVMMMMMMMMIIIIIISNYSDDKTNLRGYISL
jgi:hypothetical protein